MFPPIIRCFLSLFYIFLKFFLFLLKKTLIFEAHVINSVSPLRTSADLVKRFPGLLFSTAAFKFRFLLHCGYPS